MHKTNTFFLQLNDDFQTKTRVGGVITVVSSLIMAVLFCNELREYVLCSSWLCVFMCVRVCVSLCVYVCVNAVLFINV
jgi:hypothetical protein